MAYDRLYPFGFERDHMLNAHLCRQVAFGALSEPSQNLSDYYLYKEPPRELTKREQAEQHKQQQQKIADTLDTIFGF